MQTTFTFGKFGGIPLKVHINWFLTVALVTWSLAAGFFPQEYPGWGSEIYWSLGLATAFLFFFSVLLHELGHAVVALREAVPVESITLFIFGGVAHIANEPETPGAEFRIVAAGPLTSLMLAAFFRGVSMFAVFGPQVGGAADYLSRINLILALFNLIPGFPLDGGRIMRSILWKLTSSFKKATRWAAHVGMAIALSFIFAGVGVMVLGQFMSGLWIAFIGWYLTSAVQEGYRQADEEDDLPVDGPGREAGQGQPASQNASHRPWLGLGQPPFAYIPIRPSSPFNLDDYSVTPVHPAERGKSL
ncbi:MAG TPA: site-2 protease family protein [Anaerolineales bacterium]